ncbi:predicted protein [Naegleria gruberi]|uniref:Predicted protein n=1 Tax=Naegleria gruberi TaxID=5762 RepID=D2V039_NAEGR|nr:uncharacterized protein NAEGRDRAFT_62159 [Naegleria gruberi]EFC49647.1 predicted protein [Naegleria gruberi]|eukprot:XP_002682391.1 predicted protein [Naegleria gruberi strain NEG-M]
MYKQQQLQLQLFFSKTLNCSAEKAQVNSSRNELIIIDQTNNKINIYDLISCSLKYVIGFSVSVWMEYIDQSSSQFRAISIAVDETRPDEAILLLEYQMKRIMTKIPLGRSLNSSYRLASWRVVSEKQSVSVEFSHSLSCDGEGRVYSMFNINGKPRGQVGVFDFDSGKLLGVFDFNNIPQSFGIFSFYATKDYFYITFADNARYTYIRAFHKNFPKDNQFFTIENSLKIFTTFDEWDIRGCHCRISHITELLEKNKFIYRSLYNIIERTFTSSMNSSSLIHFDNKVKSIIHYDSKRGELYCSEQERILVFKYPPSGAYLSWFCNKLFKLARNCFLVDISFK